MFILICSPALAATNGWYLGGGYDGYDRGSDRGGIGCPQVNNAGGATNVTIADAWLNGVLLVTGSVPTEVHVYWGPADGMTNKEKWAAVTNLGVCGEGQALTVNVNVNSNTAYYYRFYAATPAGEDGWASASACFVTPAAPGLNSAAGAAPVSYTTAILNGKLAGGVSANVYVCWGQNPDALVNTNSLGLRRQGTFRTAVSNLAPETAYYYRCYGTNSEGCGWSDTVAFTTLVESVNFTGSGGDGYDSNPAR